MAITYTIELNEEQKARNKNKDGQIAKFSAHDIEFINGKSKVLSEKEFSDGIAKICQYNKWIVMKNDGKDNIKLYPVEVKPKTEYISERKTNLELRVEKLELEVKELNELISKFKK